jgi:uncharacterized protein YlxW (UPF0749 family)
MATGKEQAQAEVYRLESEVRSAEGELNRVLRSEDQDRAKGIDRVGPARAALTNAKRALDLARAHLRKF